ncbi:MAG: hypothetical protein ABEI07_02275, partial [Candidatus Nanohaloarchaea archaeon]
NNYRIETVEPLVLQPSGEQYFKSFGTERITADYFLTKMDNRTYNITQYDSTATYSERYHNLSDLPRDYASGPVNTTTCDSSYPYTYKLGNITVEGEKHAFLLVNFEVTKPCDQYYEYIYFDFPRSPGGSGDGDFNDGSSDLYSGDGPHQNQDVLKINNHSYRLTLHLDGNGTTLERMGQRTVGEIPVSTDIEGRGGSAALIQRQDLGDDDMHLVTSLIAYETQEETQFTPSRSLGDTSLGYTYTSTLGEDTPVPYTLNTVWWYQ